MEKLFIKRETKTDKIVEIVDVLQNHCSEAKWVCILHEGENCSPHYHIACSFSSERDLEDVAKIFDVKNSQVEKCRGLSHQFLCYFVDVLLHEKGRHLTSEIVAFLGFLRLFI